MSWWQAHAGRIATVQVMGERGLVLAASHDSQVSLWTLHGALVGRFGHHTWRLDDLSTFADPEVGARMQPWDK